jgi:hypothetical protein
MSVAKAELAAKLAKFAAETRQDCPGYHCPLPNVLNTPPCNLWHGVCMYWKSLHRKSALLKN